MNERNAMRYFLLIIALFPAWMAGTMWAAYAGFMPELGLDDNGRRLLGWFASGLTGTTFGLWRVFWVTRRRAW